MVSYIEKNRMRKEAAARAEQAENANVRENSNKVTSMQVDPPSDSQPNDEPETPKKRGRKKADSEE